MRHWVVGGALIEGDGGLLLVQNRRRDGRVDWTPPGGVIDEGETVLEGLTREVHEETGLRVTRWRGPVYEVVADAPDLGWRMRVEVHLAEEYEGELRVEDPDGIVVDARFVAVDDCRGHLHGVQAWVREPLSDWLGERWAESRPYAYRVDGADTGALVVVRL